MKKLALAAALVAAASSASAFAVVENAPADQRTYIAQDISAAAAEVVWAKVTRDNFRNGPLRQLIHNEGADSAETSAAWAAYNALDAQYQADKALFKEEYFGVGGRTPMTYNGVKYKMRDIAGMTATGAYTSVNTVQLILEAVAAKIAAESSEVGSQSGN